MLKIPIFWGVVLAGCLSWASWAMVYKNISPIESPNIAFPAFYISIFLSLCFSGIIFFALIKKAFFSTVSSYICLKHAGRKGVLFATAGVVYLLLLQYDRLTWVEVVLVALLGLFIEMMFWEKKGK